MTAKDETSRGNQGRAMAHLRPLPAPKCTCGKKATVQLFNGFNAGLSTYCGPCGQRALREYKAGA